MEKKEIEFVIEDTKKECEHIWQVVLSVNYMPWEDFMKYRGDLEQATFITETLTHTLFCSKCKQIKKV